MIGRFQRYGANVGRMGVAQFVAILALFAWIIATSPGVVAGIFAGALASAFFLMWVMRPLLLHKPGATSRVLNVTALIVLGVVVVHLGGLAKLPAWVGFVMIVVVPLHLAATFWFYSDEGVMTSRRLQTMMRGAPASYVPAGVAGDDDDGHERAEVL